MARTNIDTSGERFGSPVTIAHLAEHSFDGLSSNTLNIYQVDAILSTDWKFELENVELEYALGAIATFKDGSKLSVSAWDSCCRDGDPDYGDCFYCGGRYSRRWPRLAA